MLNFGVSDFHHLRAAAAHRDADVTERVALEPNAGRLMVIGTTDIAKLGLRRMLELFDPVEVLQHREHSSMELFTADERQESYRVFQFAKDFLAAMNARHEPVKNLRLFSGMSAFEPVPQMRVGGLDK